MAKITKVQKRDGSIVPFDETKIKEAIFKALTASGQGDGDLAGKLTRKVVNLIERRFKEGEIPHVEQIQDIVEEVLILENLVKAAKAYILYREQRRRIREATIVSEEAVERVDQYLEKLDWEVQENANMAFSLQGLNHYVTAHVVKKYWLDKIYPKEIREAVQSGDMHIHNLDTLGPYCVGWDLYDLLMKGFGGVPTKIESRPAKHFRAALGQVVNFMYTMQGECYSQDTQVLTEGGWKYFYELTPEDKVFTLNIQTNEIELQKPIRFYKYFFDGKLYNFKSKKLDLLVTPKHRMLVDQYSPHSKELYKRKFVEAKDFKVSEHFIPKTGIWKGKEEKYFVLPGIKIFQFRNYQNPRIAFLQKENFGTVLSLPEIKILTSKEKEKYEIVEIEEKKILMEDWLAFFGLWLAEGSTTLRKRKGKDGKDYFEYQVRISQNKGKKLEEFEKILKKLPFHYRKKISKRNPKKIEIEITNKQLFLYLRQFGDNKTKFIPKEIKNLSPEKLKILFDWLIKGDGYKGNGNLDFYTKSKRLADDFQEIALKLGLSANIYEKKKGKFKWYRVGISKRKHFKFKKENIKKVKYKGFVFCVEVPNHTLYVRRNGKATWCGNCAGAVSFSNFDTLLAPFIRYDNLNYQQVKQALQEFLFNMAVPTRVGFQCLSEDTQILTPLGWKWWYEVNEGDTIYTFNLKTQALEKKKVKKVFRWFYQGKMYNLKNRNQDQLLSPRHRIVRQIFNNDEKYILEPIEKALKLKSPIPIPTSGVLKNNNPDVEIDDNKLKLLAWILSEGSIEKEGSYRVSIYQSSTAHPEYYREIKTLLEEEGLEFKERTQTSLGTCQHIRLLPSSSKKIHEILGAKEKYFPSFLFKLSQRQARIFLETYVKGDGWKEKYRTRIVVTDKKKAEALLAIAVLAGYNVNLRIRKSQGISRKTQYLITLSETKNDYIQEIKEVDYKGIIWSVNTDNETVIAMRNGQVFITGNSPFTNITLDLKPSTVFEKLPVIIGGKPQKETYQEFEEEMKIFDKALYEVYQEGDRNGKPFHFPIPTINITKDFPWQEPAFDGIFEASAKYGINYFANYINSDMRPEDVRSMCCRLRLNLKELYNRGGGGLFGAGSLTGSIGVVTINLPRIGYLSKTKKEFFQRLKEVMDLAKESLEIKRKVLENLTEKGLYPYSKYWLSGIKNTRGSYWANHFSTIGIVGMNEACLNFLGENIASKRGRKFALEVLDFMREILVKYQQETGNVYNLEATPAESTAYRLAQKDREKYPDIICAGTKKIPYYTNSSQLPVNYTDDIFEALKLQDELQCKYSGGTVLHIFLGERMQSGEGVKILVKKIFENFKLPYITITPTFSICPVHGYISGEHFFCPKCTIKQPCEVYSRIVGYIRPVSQWNEGKRQEFKERKEFKIKPSQI